MEEATGRAELPARPWRWPRGAPSLGPRRRPWRWR
jgi:hypothetical protein